MSEDKALRALMRYSVKVAAMSRDQLRREANRLGSIARNPINKATMIEAKRQIVEKAIKEVP